jgi:hypothetical protein
MKPDGQAQIWEKNCRLEGSEAATKKSESVYPGSNYATRIKRKDSEVVEEGSQE